MFLVEKPPGHYLGYSKTISGCENRGCVKVLFHKHSKAELDVLETYQ